MEGKFVLCLHLQISGFVKMHKGSNLAFRSDKKEIESPDVCWDTCVGSIVTKHTHSTTLGKFVIFVIEVF